MNALQYAFTLDADFDMQAVRDRVAARQHLLRGTPGLRWKAWLIAEPLPDRPQPKQYAPLYLFEDAASTLGFLSGALYRGVTDAFGWTQPRQGPGLSRGLAEVGSARACSMHTQALKTHDDLLEAMGQPGPVHRGLLGQCSLFDVSRMELRTYSLWRLPPEEVEVAAEDTCFEVVAVSMGVAAP